MALKTNYEINELDGTPLDDAISNIIKNRAKVMHSKIVKDSNVGKTGRYKRGWVTELNSSPTDVGINLKATIRNSDRWMLTHLLAYPHKGKWGNDVPATNHFIDIVNKEITEHQKDIKQIDVTEHILAKKLIKK